MQDIVVLTEEEEEAYNGIEKLRALGWTVVAYKPEEVKELREGRLQGYEDLEEYIRDRVGDF